MTRSTVADDAAERLRKLRASRPLVHMIANYVSMDVAANALLAIGASPAMAHAREEVEEFVGLSGALVVNIGTLSPPWIEAMGLAAARARRIGVPWALDPVGVGATRLRNEASVALLAHKPAAIRGNASEIMALAALVGAARGGARPKGVDSANTTSEAEDAACALARATGAVVAATGVVDFVTDGDRAARIAGGHDTMTRVTALGCALSGVVGAFLAAGDDVFAATSAALGVFGVAGTQAGARASGPGSFRVAFLDALAQLTPADIAARLEVAP